LWYIAHMRLLFIADGRSPTTHSWLRHWIETGHQVHLVSSYPCEPPFGLASFHIIPVAFSGLAGRQTGRSSSSPRNDFIKRFRNHLLSLRYTLGPLSLPSYQTNFRRLLEEIKPDLVHALRIPFEGMLACATPMGTPLVVSIWGNDLTLHARGSSLMARLTRRTLQRVDGLIADTQRDIRLAYQWDYTTCKPSQVVPGGGGVQLEEINSVAESVSLPEELPDVPIIVNPRGQRPGSLRQDIFFQSIPLVLEKFPQVLFVCPPLAGDPEAEHWIETLGIQSNSKLWPLLNRAQMLLLLKKARVFVSPSVHDGTPNSLLEAMACGCLPVVGNIDSMREWVTSGVNGLLVEVSSPRSLADGIIAALENQSLYLAAKNENARIIATRAEYSQCMAMTEAFYQLVKGNK
jgi:glycosyltransferase involved in cell wall biosynthesis